MGSPPQDRQVSSETAPAGGAGSDRELSQRSGAQSAVAAVIVVAIVVVAVVAVAVGPVVVPGDVMERCVVLLADMARGIIRAVASLSHGGNTERADGGQ